MGRENKTPECPYREGKDCDHRVGREALDGSGVSYSLLGASITVCAICLEGMRSRAYIKKIFENTCETKRS